MVEYLCKKLKELRLEHGFSKEELAFKLGISTYRLTRLENLTLKATIYEMALLTCHLKAKANYITGESSIRRYPDNIKYEKYEKKYNNIKCKK